MSLLSAAPAGRAARRRCRASRSPALRSRRGAHQQVPRTPARKSRWSAFGAASQGRGLFFVLTSMPMAVCPFCETEAQWPDDIVSCSSARRSRRCRSIGRSGYAASSRPASSRCGDRLREPRPSGRRQVREALIVLVAEAIRFVCRARRSIVAGADRSHRPGTPWPYRPSGRKIHAALCAGRAARDRGVFLRRHRHRRAGRGRPRRWRRRNVGRVPGFPPHPRFVRPT